jgi:uroporphyrinogen decarboxylase
MGQSSPLENILSTVRLEEPERVPIITLEQEHAVSIMGIKYSEFATDPEKLAQTHLNVIRRYGLDWAWVHVDDWIEFEAMGNKIQFFDETVPQATEYAIKSESDIDKLKIPDPQRDGRMPYLLKGIKILAQKIGSDHMICGRVVAPFSSMTLLRGLQTGILDTYRNPQMVKRLLEVGFNVAKTYAEAQLEAGAHAIWVGDCMASSRIISDRHFEELALPYTKRLIYEIRRMGGITFLFSDEKEAKRLQTEATANPDVLGIGTAVTMDVAKELLGEKICLCGNVDPLEVLRKGSVKTVEKAVVEGINACAKGGGYILSTGEEVARDTPPENIETFVKTALRVGKYPLHN